MSTPGDRRETPPQVAMVRNAAEGAELALQELRLLLERERGRRPLVSFATGATYAPLLRRLAEEIGGGAVRTDAFLATHLDEYLGFAPDRRGGMVHELGQHCPPLLAMLRQGSFLPVPCDGAAASLGQHEARLRRAGGVRLQFLGIGRNGHLAFNEPGTAFDLGFHVTELAATTRDDARARFLPDEPPTRAATAGIASILAAERLVLLAFGRGKAPAVRAMLQGEVGPACPASALRRHANALVVLDPEAAAELGGAAGGQG